MRIWFALIMIIYILLSWLIARQLYDLLNVNVVAFTLIFIILAASPLLNRVGHFGLLEKVGNYWVVFFYYATIVAVLETLFRTYTKKGTSDTVNGDQKTGTLFCYRYFVWGPKKEPG